MNSLSFDRVPTPDDAIQWHDGLLLAPLHFEQLSQRSEDLLTYHVRNGHPYAWGLRTLVLRIDRLKEGVFAVAELEAIMPDGLLVIHNESEHGPLQLELDKRMMEGGSQQQRQRVFLSVPLARAEQQEQNKRFLNAGKPSMGLPRLRPNLRLALESQLTPTYATSLPLARVMYQLQEFRIDQYLPPMLSIDMLAPAASASLRALSQDVRKLMTRAESNLLDAIAATPPADLLRRLDLRMQLHSVTHALPQLSALLQLESVAPRELYLQLCGVFGSVCMLRDLNKPVPPLSGYVHQDPEPGFTELFSGIRDLLAYVDREYDELSFSYDGESFSLQLDPDKLQGWPARLPAAVGGKETPPVLLIGVFGLPENQAREWLAGSVIACTSALPGLLERRVIGLQRYFVDDQCDLLHVSPSDNVAIARDKIRVGVRGQRADGMELFALQIDDALLRFDEQLMILPEAKAPPKDVVLVLAKPTRATGAAT